MFRVALRSIAISPHRHHHPHSIPHLPSRRCHRLRSESTPPSKQTSATEPSQEESEGEHEIGSSALNEMLEEVKDAKALGSRGEGWMLSVFLACGLFLFPPVNLFGLITAMGWIASSAGLVLLSYAVLVLGSNNFPLPYPRTQAEFVNHGIYAHVRHPQYGGILLLCLGICAITRNETRGAFCVLLWYLFERLIQFEERALKERFDSYTLYCDQTKKLIPGVY